MKLSACFISIVLFVVYKIPEAEACKCAVVHPQVNFCQADFAIKAKVTKKTTLANKKDVVYTVTNVQKYKATNGADTILNAGKIYTNSQSAACGVMMDVGKTYVMTGSISNKQARIITCGFIREWSLVPMYQRKQLRSIYQNGCDCEIDSDVNTTSDDKCTLTDSPSCYFRFAACQRNCDGVCEWLEGEDLEECLAEEAEGEEE